MHAGLTWGAPPYIGLAQPKEVGREKMEDPEGEEERKRNRERLMLAAQTRRVVRETVWECMSAWGNKGKGKGSRKGKGRRAEDERAEGEPAARRPRREARERSQS